jgi:hypothetical protein
MATNRSGAKTSTTTKPAPRSSRVKPPIASPAATRKAATAKAGGGAKTAKPAGAKTMTAAAGAPATRKRLTRPQLAARKAAGAGGADATAPARKAKPGTAMGLKTGKGAA